MGLTDSNENEGITQRGGVNLKRRRWIKSRRTLWVGSLWVGDIIHRGV